MNAKDRKEPGFTTMNYQPPILGPEDRQVRTAILDLGTETAAK